MIHPHAPRLALLSRRSPPRLTTAALIALSLSACADARPQGLTVGSQAPEFSLPSSSGATVSLADYRGRQPVLLYFHMALG